VTVRPEGSPRGVRRTDRPLEPDLPTGAAKSAAVRSMFDAIAPRYDLVNRVMTLRMDIGWRRRSVAALGLRPGSLVVDVACGTGDLCRALADAGHRAVGVDFSAGMLAVARTKAPLVLADALRMPFGAAVADGLTCGFALRNVVDLDRLFAELARVLRSGGRVAILEVARPEISVLRWGHRIYFERVVPLIGSALSDRDAYRYLPRSAAYLPERGELVALLEHSGFGGVRSDLLGLGAAQLITGTRA
jgi:demethylmenaquinone methyltransferase/2-methoxy-6-polyprenyl-1,4-benzoquinol methylase